MIKKILLVILLVAFQQTITSQESKTCATPKEDIEIDLNSISLTKCSIKTTKEKAAPGDRNSKRVSIQVSTRRRVVRKRDAVSGVANAKKSHKIASIKEKASLIGSLDLSTEEVVDKVPFNLVEEIPLFKSCESKAIAEQQKCFKQEISKHIRRNFEYPKKAYENSVQGRVFAQFVIDKTGAVTDLNIRGPYKGELLEAEAKKIVNRLPKFVPGKHNGKPVKVKYGIPITFKIPGRRPSNVKKVTRKQGLNVVLNEKEIVSFAAVEQIPAFPSCKSIDMSAEDCFNTEISRHINKHFAYPDEAVNENIEGKVIVYFVIDKTGHIVNIKTKAKEGRKSLELATRKLIEKLPKFKPGRHDGEIINVKHSFPINFVLD